MARTTKYTLFHGDHLSLFTLEEVVVEAAVEEEYSQPVAATEVVVEEAEEALRDVPCWRIQNYCAASREVAGAEVVEWNA